MKQRSMFYISSILIALVIILALLLFKVIPFSNAVALGISIIALIVSILSSFKNELFPFELSVFTDRLHLVACESLPPITGKSIVVLLPITFFNRGYSEGIIQEIKLFVKAKKSGIQKEFLPSFEVDMAAFIQQRKGLNASNSLGVFVGFLLEAKRAVKKNIVFGPKVESGTSPYFWQPDIYTFEIFVQVYGEKEAKKYFELKQEIDKNALTMLATGKFQSLYFYPDKKSEIS